MPTPRTVTETLRTMSPDVDNDTKFQNTQCKYSLKHLFCTWITCFAES